MNKNINSEKLNNKMKMLGGCALWLALSVLIIGCLIPLFSQIWKENTRKHSEEECKLLADAVLENYVVNEDRQKKSDDFERLYYYDMNAMSGWGHVYGGTNKEELEKIYDWSEQIPEAIAVWQGSEYNVVEGIFPRKEFDAALEKIEKRRYSDYYGVPVEEAEFLVFDGILSITGTSAIDTMGGYIYILSEFYNAKAVVISRFPYDTYLNMLAGGEEITRYYKLEEGYVSDSKVNLVLVQKSDNVVVQATSGINIGEGDILESDFDENGRLSIGDEWYAGGIAENELYRVYALVNESDFISRNVVSPIVLSLAFVIVFLLTGTYALFVRDDIRRRRVQKESLTDNEDVMGEVLLRRTRLMFYIIASVATVLVLIICLLCIVDSNRVWGDDILEDVERYYELDRDRTEIMSLFRDEYKQRTLGKMRDMLEASPERMTEKAICDLSEAVERDIFVLDKNGAVVVSSDDEYDFTDITNPDSSLYAISGMLAGKADNITASTINDEAQECLCWGTRFKTRDGALITMDNSSQMITDSDYYANYQAPEGMTLFAVDLSTGRILSCSDVNYSGKNAANIGLEGEVLNENFAGDIMLNGRRAFVHTRIIGGRADIIAGDLGYIFMEYLPIILMTLATGLFITIVFLLTVFFIQQKIWTDPLAGSDNVSEKKHHDEKAVVGRWLNPLIPFKDQSADSKFHTVLHVLVALILIIGYVLYQNAATNSLLGDSLPYLLQRNWRFGLNIYAVTYALLIDCVIIVVGLTIRMIILFAGSKFGSRGETIARLFGSFITYASIVGAIGYGLVFLGVNTTAIFASAGIVGLAISIGAKDLIADVFAGIFIVFEGEFRTGDIVDIKGYRGTVEEIGVRTTKVMSMENVKVFRNTEVSGAINMTQRYSIAEVRIDVSRGEPLEKIEEIFVNELPAIRKKVTYEISEIQLCGIDQMNANGLVLLFQTNCKESDRIFVERELRREFDLLMEREQITTSGAIGAASIRKRDE